MSDGGITTSRRRRGVTRASNTKLADRINELEMRVMLFPPDKFKAQQSQKKLEGLDADFKGYHFKVVDPIEEEEELEREQVVLDEHDDRVTDLSYRLQQLLSPDVRDSKAGPDPRRHLYTRMARIEQNL